MSACSFNYLDNLRTSKHGGFFVDQYDRHLILHGLNVSGACKLPRVTDYADLDPANETFWEPTTFVGRPFPVEEAKQHFEKLAHFGTSLIRFVITWESLELSPGVYDEKYLEYLRVVLSIASDTGLLIVLDCHQDCWSRFTGGSGAPLWTMDIVGLIPRHFEACGAALLQKPITSGYGKAGTLWATNYTKFAVNTMFTLFFGGETFAPDTLIDGESIGPYLRRHYIAAFIALLRQLQGIPRIVGIDLMNEPHHGFIGMQSLHKFDEDVLLHLESMPTALQSMRLAAGISQSVPVYSRSWPRPTSCTAFINLNAEGVKAWKDEASDVWRLHDVWDVDGCKEDYFYRFPTHHRRAGQPVEFIHDFYVPFLREFHDAFKETAPRLYTLIEPVPNVGIDPMQDFVDSRNICFAPHWYDLKALFEKRFSSRVTMNVQALSQGSRNFLAHTYFGHNQAIDNYTKQYAGIFQNTSSTFPRLVGETGVPFDMNSHYQTSCRRGKDNDYGDQEEMMDIMCTAMERNILSYTLWNYTPENSAYAGGGDLWNGEDFSVYCESEVMASVGVLPKYAGTRAAKAWIRPSAVKIAGYPLVSQFQLQKGVYVLEFIPTNVCSEMSRTTEIFIPQLHITEQKLVVECRGPEYNQEPSAIVG
ncbi:protein of unknown function [Taphrina deformans PYCC 5710]|uniref:Glycoside hydrolase family 5 C-terminal domain-containing protein n=1 Tax=Taphrina deformans (strain PYCC 5710 / ATCC 11124 / CBS 356.35 / IMI 108563 / JCM 9778 / NBRC 8474) TaxID=1097556 RepID=R4XFA0_TAPDE|nr:protein of unknown function [Taphrina deformans PYCC 5710]|eukprot:CCG84343.1 protein of unknown function [Taphrina deformans PYCC 5710]